MSDEELVAMIAHGTKTLYQSSKDLAVIEKMALKYNLAEAIRYLRLRQSINAEMLNLFLEAGMISA